MDVMDISFDHIGKWVAMAIVCGFAAIICLEVCAVVWVVATALLRLARTLGVPRGGLPIKKDKETDLTVKCQSPSSHAIAPAPAWDDCTDAPTLPTRASNGGEVRMLVEGRSGTHFVAPF